MSMCEEVSDRMPAAASGRSEWTAEERAHLASCSDCAAEWMLVVTASNLGRDVTVDAAALTPLVLNRARAAKVEATRQRWLRQSIVVAGLAIAAVVLLMLVPARNKAPEVPLGGVMVEARGGLQLAELDDAAPADLEMVLAEFDERVETTSTLDGPDLEGLDISQMDSALRSWEES
jgi:hypothetical protein